MDSLEKQLIEEQLNRELKDCLAFERHILMYVPNKKRVSFINSYGHIMRDMFNNYIRNEVLYENGKKETEDYKQQELF